MTLRNLAHSVVNGRRVTFHRHNAEPVVGYFSGYDDDFYYVLVPENDTTFSRKHVARRFLTGIDISETSTYSDEPCRAQMEPTVKACRSHMIENVLHR